MAPELWGILYNENSNGLTISRKFSNVVLSVLELFHVYGRSSAGCERARKVYPSWTPLAVPQCSGHPPCDTTLQTLSLARGSTVATALPQRLTA
jgi:hypothetical protein